LILKIEARLAEEDRRRLDQLGLLLAAIVIVLVWVSHEQ